MARKKYVPKGSYPSPIGSALLAFYHLKPGVTVSISYCEGMIVEHGVEGYAERISKDSWVVHLDVDQTYRSIVKCLIHELTHCLGIMGHGKAFESGHTKMLRAFNVEQAKRRNGVKP